MDGGQAPGGPLGPCHECGLPLPKGTQRYCVHCGAEVIPSDEPSWFESPMPDGAVFDSSVTRPAPLTSAPRTEGPRRPTTWSSGDYRAPSPTDAQGLALPPPPPPPGVEWNGPGEPLLAEPETEPEPEPGAAELVDPLPAGTVPAAGDAPAGEPVVASEAAAGGSAEPAQPVVPPLPTGPLPSGSQPTGPPPTGPPPTGPQPTGPQPTGPRVVADPAAVPAPFTWPADMAAMENMLPFAPQRPMSAGPIRLEIAYPPDPLESDDTDGRGHSLRAMIRPAGPAVPPAPAAAGSGASAGSGAAAGTAPGPGVPVEPADRDAFPVWPGPAAYDSSPASVPGFPPPAPVVGPGGVPVAPAGPPVPGTLPPGGPPAGHPAAPPAGQPGGQSAGQSGGAAGYPSGGPFAPAGPQRSIDVDLDPFGGPSGLPLGTGDDAWDRAFGATQAEPAPRNRGFMAMLVVAGVVLVTVTGATLWWFTTRPSDERLAAANPVSAPLSAAPTGSSAASGATATSGVDPASQGATGAAGDAPPASESASPTDSPSPSTSASAAEFATAMDGLLDESAAARTNVSSTVAALQSCRTSASKAASTLRAAGKARTALATRGGALDPAGVPGGPDIVDAFVSLQKASAAADDSFAAWADDITRSGCRSAALHTANWAQGNTHSAEATAAKSRFVALWNRVATAEGQRTRSTDGI
jgi:hypothetical protein